MTSMIHPYKVWSMNNNFLGIVYSYNLENAHKYGREIFGEKFGYVQLLLSVEV